MAKYNCFIYIYIYIYTQTYFIYFFMYFFLYETKMNIFNDKGTIHKEDG